MTAAAQDDWFSADAATFGDRLAGAREATGQGQAELAAKLGVRAETLASWEDDVNEPRANRLQMLAGMLGVSIMWLLTGEGDGIAGPDVIREDNRRVGDILADMRQIRTEMGAMGTRLGRLEKNLRLALAEV
jgi:transcriptional regulator with XRE-family HTH domain